MTGNMLKALYIAYGTLYRKNIGWGKSTFIVVCM